MTAGALAAFGGAAYADTTADLAVSVTGTTLAATASGKISDVTITNNGPGKASGVALAFDLNALDQDKVTFEVPDDEACDIAGSTLTCGVVDVAAGASLDLPIELTRKAGTGEAGTLTVAVTHDDTDPNTKNNSVTVKVAVGESGPDLYSFAPDMPFDFKSQKVGSVAPGGTAKLLYEVGNFGDQAVAGVRLTITLPKHATFVEEEPGCTYNSANTVATCTYEDLPIVPFDEDSDPNDDVFSAYRFFNVVKVAADAPAPGTLTGGSVAVEPLAAEVEVPKSAKRAAASLPQNVTGVRAVADVDNTDNTDEFGIVVADTSGGGGGGGLPVTGARVGVLGGVGLGVVVVGAILLLVARRRRVVPIAPKDEAPTA